MNTKIVAAKVDAVLDPNLCFFGSLLCNLKFSEDTSCDTAWTDGTNLGFNPEFIDSLSHAEIVGLLAHEVMHCASAHPYRRDSRDIKKWNVACDYAINQILTESGITLPKDALVCPKDFIGKSAEWIYDRLPDNPKGNDGSGKGSDKGDGIPVPGEVRDSPNDGVDPDKVTAEEWGELTRQAANQAKMRGKLPAGLARFSDKVTASRVDWKSALRKFIEQNAKADYSWSAPSKRWVSQDMFMPSMKSEDMGRIVIGVDTSGSMDDIALAAAKAEVLAVMDEVNPLAVDVMYADAKVAKHDTFERGEEVIFAAAGGGGTDFRPVFEAVEAMDEKPVCIIYITDMCGSFPESSDIPTLWVTDTTHINAPFGETICMSQ